jgi:predicted ATPase
MSVLTKWNVITGAPCSGKSTLVKELNNLGHRIVPETAREIIHDTRDPCESSSQLQLKIFNAQKKKESLLSPQISTFLDRAMPDTLAYLKLSGDIETLKSIAPYCSDFKYHNIFILSPVPIENDGLRITNPKTIEDQDQTIEVIYKELGYSPIRIPCFESDSIEKRLNFILNVTNLRKRNFSP